jgi:hypothetical protein
MIVYEVLPRFAEKLAHEGVIASFSHPRFKLWLIESIPMQEIRPDGVFTLSNGKKVLVEVVNPKDPRRFIGEIASSLMLQDLYREHIMLFVFVRVGEKTRIELGQKRTVLLNRLIQKMNAPRSLWISEWINDEEKMFTQLRSRLRLIYNLYEEAKTEGRLRTK